MTSCSPGISMDVRWSHLNIEVACILERRSTRTVTSGISGDPCGWSSVAASAIYFPCAGDVLGRLCCVMSDALPTVSSSP